MKWLASSYLSLIYFFFYFPILILIIYSFNDARYSLLWHGVTLQWYQNLFDDSDLWLSVWHSLILGISAASIATFIGLIAAISFYRYRFFGQHFLNSLVFILILSPEIVMAVSLLILFILLNVPLGFTSLLLAHVTFCVPFVIVTTYSRLILFDQNIFEAAKDLGANDWQIFLKIIIPLLSSTLLAGWLLSFTLSLDDVIISYFVSGPEFEILPLRIYAMVRSGIKPEINALCSVLFAFTLILIILAQVALKKRNTKKNAQTI